MGTNDENAAIRGGLSALHEMSVYMRAELQELPGDYDNLEELLHQLIVELKLHLNCPQGGRTLYSKW